MKHRGDIALRARFYLLSSEQREALLALADEPLISLRDRFYRVSEIGDHTAARHFFSQTIATLQRRGLASGGRRNNKRRQTTIVITDLGRWYAQSMLADRAARRIDGFLQDIGVNGSS